ncbi:MAG: TIGR03545 family protein [Campylobacterota bacterium]|nr:TIGR03545 family protein [Campylobacterota bacterium]
MDFFKLLKTLNSAQASWQITLAIVLGMISGFLPLATPINFLILFIAFAINIPLAVFFLMSVLFATLALALDPVFATLGFEVLNASALKEIFTSMYNYAPTLWSSYNYTILMGSLLISLPLALTMFPILNRLIDKYRDVLEAKFKDSKYFSWLNPYSEKKVSKKPGVMRWWAAGLFVSIVVFIAAVLLLLIDPVIKFALEYSLSKVSQRTVQIDSVESKVFQAKLDINNISFLNNGESKTDDINVDKVSLQLNTEHLLEKKIDFEIISFGNITLNTSITKKEEPVEAKNSDTNAKDASSSFETPELPKAEDLIAKEGLKSVAAAKEIQKNITAITEKWSKFAQGDGQKEKIASIEKKIKSLEKKAGSVKSPEQILPIVQEADALKKELEAINSELTQMSKEYEKDKKTIERHMKEIQTLPMEDYNHLASKYSLDGNGAMNFIGTYFSSSLEKYLRMGTKYYEMAKPYISSEEEELTPEQERMQGRWIKYASTKPYPDFVIQKLNANIILNQVNYDLKIKDISDDQKVYNKPLTGLMTSKSSDYKLFKLDFEHNELGKDILTSANSTIKEYKLPEYNAIESLSINNSLIDESSTLIVTDFENINAKISADFVKTALVYSASSSMTDKAISNILSNITSFSVDSSIGGTLDEPEIALTTDLDKKIAKGLKTQVSKEVKKYQKELQVTINKEFKKQLGDLDLGEFSDVEKLLNANTKDSNALENIIEKNISQDALQKQLSSKALGGFINKLKF